MYFSKDSSSLHTINADHGLTRSTARLWRFFNRINNGFLPNLGSDGFLKQMTCELSEEDLQLFASPASPARDLLNLFWMKMDWAALDKALGEIHICDIGCGPAGILPFLHRVSGGRIASYTGLDITPHEDTWKKLEQEYPTAKFIRADSHDISGIIPEKCNLLTTNSALEHFDQDLVFFRNLGKFANRTNNPVVQIHTIPSACCFDMYGCHGTRQYTARTARKLVTGYDRQGVTARLYGMGGPACNQIHTDFIRNPAKGDIREENMQLYIDEKIKAMKTETSTPVLEPASYYSLVIMDGVEVELL